MIGVSESDRHTVAVTAASYYRKVGFGQFQALCKGKRPAMRRMHAVGINVAGNASAAANPADNRQLMRFQAKLHGSLLQGGLHRIMSAAGTPVWFHIVTKILQYRHLQHLLATCQQLLGIHNVTVVLQNAFQTRAGIDVHS